MVITILKRKKKCIADIRIKLSKSASTQTNQPLFIPGSAFAAFIHNCKADGGKIQHFLTTFFLLQDRLHHRLLFAKWASWVWAAGVRSGGRGVSGVLEGEASSLSKGVGVGGGWQL